MEKPTQIRTFIGSLDDPRDTDWKSLAIRYQMALEIIAEGSAVSSKVAEKALEAPKLN